MRKLVFDLSLAQILPEKINQLFLPKKPGFIDVLRTVCVALQRNSFTSGAFKMRVKENTEDNTSLSMKFNSLSKCGLKKTLKIIRHLV